MSSPRAVAASQSETAWLQEGPDRGLDTATILTVYLAFLFLIPARLVLPGLGAAGRPAGLVGLGLLALWCLCRIVPGLAKIERQPLHIALALLVCYALFSWWLAYARGVLPAEGRSADRFVLQVLGLVGVAIAACDGLRTRERLDRVLVRLCWFAGAMALFGTVDFITRTSAASYIRVPGLVYNADLVAVSHRGGGGYEGQLLARVAGTALHYIEFGVVLAMVLPIAIHYALFAMRGRQQWVRWAIVGVLCLNIPFAISRSAIIGLVIVGIAMALVWTWPVLVRGAIAGFLALVFFKFVVHGILGTIISLFTNLGVDPSVKGRTNDYSAVGGFVDSRLWFGRGGGTFIPSLYRVLDNQFLLTLIEFGVVGLVVMLALFALPIVQGRVVRRRGLDDEAQHLGQAIAASGMVGLILSLTFDSLSFPTFSGVYFLLVGAAASLWRLTVVSRETPQARHRTGTILRPIRDFSRFLPETARRTTKSVTELSAGPRR